ncbi:MAG TPA: hypothetical protein VLL54_20790 [Pyrinomonadaceae bacterium]|nr:hypothetical protein [Pyrinomonadaceae bacterium]
MDKRLRTQLAAAPRPAVASMQNYSQRSYASSLAPFTTHLGNVEKRVPAPSTGGHDFSKVRVLSRDSTNSPSVNDQTQSGLDPKPAGGGQAQPAPAKAAKDDNLSPTSKPPVVDDVQLITSAAGATGGFDAIECDASLNNPGPWNDTWAKLSVANVHQVKFHVSEGNPQDLRATRMVERKSAGRGQNSAKSGWDGPPDHEYRYTKDSMVIADAPGWCKTLRMDDFPVSYTADFSTYAWDAPTKSILASISYHVEILKQHYSQDDPVNTVSVTAKKIGGAVASPVKPKK